VERIYQKKKKVITKKEKKKRGGVRQRGLEKGKGGPGQKGKREPYEERTYRRLKSQKVIRTKNQLHSPGVAHNLGIDMQKELKERDLENLPRGEGNEGTKRREGQSLQEKNGGKGKLTEGIEAQDKKKEDSEGVKKKNVEQGKTRRA